jgi:hypothetical protein
MFSYQIKLLSIFWGYLSKTRALNLSGHALDRGSISRHGSQVSLDKS